jgi:hypothetical protein
LLNSPGNENLSSPGKSGVYYLCIVYVENLKKMFLNGIIIRHDTQHRNHWA